MYLQQVKRKNIYFIVYYKYRTFTSPKISYVLKKKVGLPFICSKCNNDERKIFKEEESFDISKLLDLIIDIEDQQNKDE